MPQPPDLDMMPFSEFINFVRDRPDLFPREATARRARVDPITLYRLLRRNPRDKLRQDPKLSTVRAILAGCGGELFVGFRPLPAGKLTATKR
jgi:hypothetical protein